MKTSVAGPASHDERLSATLRRFLQGMRRAWNANPPQRASEYRRALAVLESHQRAQQRLFAHDMAAERCLREQAEISESDLRRTIELKDAVIADANHRVKNTLQVAASLLSTHARATTRPEVRSALQASCDRLNVLARVHELLSASAESTQAIFVPTLLHALGSALRQSFAEISARVQLQITSDPIALPADSATALALLANEAMTNAYKHAFQNGAAGVITVELHCTPRGAMVLQIADSGMGMPADGMQNGGLGLKLIRTFAAQLRGALVVATMAGASGTAITLTVPPDAKGQRLEKAPARGVGP